MMPENLAARFDIHRRTDPDAIALVVGDESYDRAAVGEMADRAVAMLKENGFKAGDRVVVQYDTSVEDVAVAIATARLGGTLIPVPKRLGVREINFLLERSQAALFCHVGTEPTEGLAPPASARVISTRSIASFEPLSAEVVETPGDHCALIGVTSGSTGQPKGVMHSWSGVAWSAERMRALGRVQDREAILMTGAGAGAPGFTFFTYMPLVTGATVVRASRWNPVEVLRLAKRHDCVWSCMVPTMLRMLLDAGPEALGGRKLEAMRSVSMGGGFMSLELIDRARSELGMEVLRMYAMAECMCNASTELSDPVEVRNVLDGRPGPGAELAVFDDERQPLPTGSRGEIGLKGPSLLLGYLGEPDGKSSLMTADGFFLSGDIGVIDEAGFVRVVGRKKDMINRGGYKIDPSEVEELIGRNPAVGKVAVVGFPDDLYGERSCAVVELRDGHSLEFDDLKSYLVGEGLSKEKLPERFEVWDALPLSPDGKILKGAVKQRVGTDPASALG
ncbi:short chain acyl-CoA synthetase [Novosphingobium marinum]|uniref:Acyl-CoA synthetase (AMP-forming)/AMP-acid ligase II n=2 Tax=Novosphingobium marinum TaxID=1514948 RepID=A0A7Y9XVW2_9SPHN|nr:acyl-CoA synthetase (AMP-forming)/AMP-acid ligase II [Novosphingobium marinum]GGC27542.1 short chain acyl-CoA synthetase [Novosphingobium marinum]